MTVDGDMILALARRVSRKAPRRLRQDAAQEAAAQMVKAWPEWDGRLPLKLYLTMCGRRWVETWLGKELRRGLRYAPEGVWWFAAGSGRLDEAEGRGVELPPSPLRLPGLDSRARAVVVGLVIREESAAVVGKRLGLGRTQLFKLKRLALDRLRSAYGEVP